MKEDAQSVLERLIPVEREIRDDAGRWYLTRLLPYRSTEDRIEGVVITFIEISSRKQAELHQNLLMGELNHRVKNTLAVVQSLANQTLRATPEPALFAESFQSRLHALARTHTLLTRRRWESADLAELVEDQFAADGSAVNISWKGPPANLSPQAAVALALILHELETNARKHGALSATAGKVHLSWEVSSADNTARMQWLESCGPRVSSPEKQGFGTTLIETSLQGVGGHTHTEYRREGLVCQVTVPLASPETAS